MAQERLVGPCVAEEDVELGRLQQIVHELQAGGDLQRRQPVPPLGAPAGLQNSVDPLIKMIQV